MSIRLGDGTVVAGGTVSFPLLSTMWADHILNDVSWLRADTFSWQSGDVYKSVYEKLVAEYSTGTTETEGAIIFKRTESGFKIAESTQEQAILDLYNSTGVAWYYILDTTNKRFKLPRMDYKRFVRKDKENSFQMPDYSRGIQIAAVGSAVNYTATVDGIVFGNSDSSVGGPIYVNGNIAVVGGNDSGNEGPFSIFVKEGDVITSTIATRGTYFAPFYSNEVSNISKYLYFFVGNYVQNQTTIDIGQISEQLNGKADVSTTVTKSMYKKWESEWFVPTASTQQTFELPQSLIDDGVENWNIKILGKIITATQGASVGDYFWIHFSNYVGSTGSSSQGVGISLSGNTLFVRQGNDATFGDPSRINFYQSYTRANTNIKVIIESWRVA